MEIANKFYCNTILKLYCYQNYTINVISVLRYLIEIFNFNCLLTELKQIQNPKTP